MIITPSLRKAINAGVRDLFGANALAEVGHRASITAAPSSPNALNWIPDADLDELYPLAELREIEDHAAIPGAATLDLYITAGRGHDRQLAGNVYVTIKGGALADLHDRDLDANTRTRAILGRPFDNDDSPE